MYGRKIKQRVVSLALAVVLAALCSPVSAAYQPSFSDVPEGAWYYDYVSLCASYGIIDGKEDGLFHPDDLLKRGEFIKLLAVVSDVPVLTQPQNHWADPYWRVLSDAGVLWGLDVTNTFESLERPISRYEMCVMIRNLCFNVYGENAVALAAPGESITDYDSMDDKYHDSVLQAFGKGIIDGFEDGSFRGVETLTRAQAAAIVVRTAWPAQRKAPEGAEEIVSASGGEAILAPGDSFAFRYRTMSDYDRRLALFGDGYKTYFTGWEYNLADYITTIEVNTWYLNEQTGVKTTKVRTLQVNRLVADEVRAIFEEIYNDPEQFPIKALGGARFTDSMRHAWGCAIDINPVENYYIVYGSGYTVGSYCYKQSNSPYCIRPGSSVTRAFAKYGWGWGGGTEANGYTGWVNSADYMHFSVLSSGG